MPKYVRNLLVVVIFSCLIISQHVQTISNISSFPSLDNESVITAVDYPMEVDAAQITSPTTFPIHDERKADSTFLVVQEIVFQTTPIAYLVHLFPHTTESVGFINVRKYQSNYLPIYI